MNIEFLHVTAAEYISGYLLKLTFSNGDVRTFDFSSIYNQGIFTKLQNPEYFRNYTLDGWTVDWNNEIGFAPEYLYEHGASSVTGFSSSGRQNQSIYKPRGLTEGYSA